MTIQRIKSLGEPFLEVDVSGWVPDNIRLPVEPKKFSWLWGCSLSVFLHATLPQEQSLLTCATIFRCGHFGTVSISGALAEISIHNVRVSFIFCHLVAPYLLIFYPILAKFPRSVDRPSRKGNWARHRI